MGVDKKCQYKYEVFTNTIIVCACVVYCLCYLYCLLCCVCVVVVCVSVLTGARVRKMYQGEL